MSQKEDITGVSAPDPPEKTRPDQQRGETALRKINIEKAIETTKRCEEKANPYDESMAVSHGVEEKRAKTFTRTNDK